MEQLHALPCWITLPHVLLPGAAAELNHTNLEAAQHARVTALNKVRPGCRAAFATAVQLGLGMRIHVFDEHGNQQKMCLRHHLARCARHH